MLTKFSYKATAAAVLLLAGAAPGFADPLLTRDTQGVMTRPRPDYDPKGLPLGGFRGFLTADLHGGYDDNVVRQDIGLSRGSAFFDEKLGAVLQSQWSRHALAIYGNVDAMQYTALPHESQTNFTAGGDGQYDISRGIDATAGGSFAALHEARQSPEQPGNALDPTAYRQGDARYALEYHPYSFAVQVGGSYQRKDYSATRISGGSLLSNTDRNEDLYGAFVKTAYEFSPGYAAFVRADYNDRSFDLLLDRNGFHRASHGYDVNGGLDLMLTDLLRGEVFVGYIIQNYKGTVLKPLQNISGVDYGVSLDWYATPLLTVHATAAHTVNDTILSGASASEDQSGGVSADYEFAENIIIQGNAGYRDSQYSGGVRDDKYTDVGIGMKYLLNHYMSLNAGYTFENRKSSVVGANYDDNILTLGLTLQE
jgi:hypothetical protein